MTYIEAIEIVVGRTKHERFRALCDDAHPDHATWRARIVAMARCPAEAPPPGPGPGTITVAESLARIAAMKACPHWSPSSSCGCGNNRCALGRGAAGIVSHRDCSDCLAGSTMPPAG